jgi:ribosomal subunit interface protein
MKIQYTSRGKNVLTEAMKSKLEEKLAKFSKRLGETEVNVIYTDEHNHKDGMNLLRLEVMLEVKGEFLKIERQGSDYYSLVDEVEEVLRRKLEKTKMSAKRTSHSAE